MFITETSRVQLVFEFRYNIDEGGCPFMEK
jgi:hypothetical protein